MSAAVTISGAGISIPALRLPGGGQSQPQTVDLTPYQGGPARVYLTADGRAVVNPAGETYWQIAEVFLPPATTRDVQTGTRLETASETVTVERGEGASDTVPLTDEQFIGQVGPDWKPYAAGTDYAVTGGTITWQAGGRIPEAGEGYLVEVVTATEVPETRQEPVPLDLSRLDVAIFDLPN